MTKRFRNSQPGHDKVYEVQLIAHGGAFDVIAQYGARTARRPAVHIHAEGVSEQKAQDVFRQVCKTRVRHGYQEVQ